MYFPLLYQNNSLYLHKRNININSKFMKGMEYDYVESKKDKVRGTDISPSG